MTDDCCSLSDDFCSLSDDCCPLSDDFCSPPNTGPNDDVLCLLLTPPSHSTVARFFVFVNSTISPCLSFKEKLGPMGFLNITRVPTFISESESSSESESESSSELDDDSDSDSDAIMSIPSMRFIILKIITEII